MQELISNTFFFFETAKDLLKQNQVQEVQG
jgi:hypothetical protein